MAKKVCLTKLKRELKAFTASPPQFVPAVHVNEANMLEWHFLMEGPPDTPFAGGVYIGKIQFPADYPFAPPDVLFITPNGRFQPSTKICMNMTSYHPETWNPSWSVATILVGLLSFMSEDAITAGSIQTTDDEKRQMASQSLAWNMSQARYKGMFSPLLEKQSTADADNSTNDPSIEVSIQKEVPA